MNAAQFSECEGCKHREYKTPFFCYMFKDKPEKLPCGQHDKYAEQRKINGEKFLARARWSM